MPRCDPDMRLEYPLKMALIGEPQVVGDLNQSVTLPEQLTAPVDPGVEQVGVRRQACGSPKRANQLITTKACFPGQ